MAGRGWPGDDQSTVQTSAIEINELETATQSASPGAGGGSVEVGRESQ